jgi:hypothetical protein
VSIRYSKRAAGKFTDSETGHTIAIGNAVRFVAAVKKYLEETQE